MEFVSFAVTLDTEVENALNYPNQDSSSKILRRLTYSNGVINLVRSRFPKAVRQRERSLRRPWSRC